MNVNDNIVKAAEFAGCVDALKEYDTLIEKIKSEKVKNVAIIGDRSCGKTTLLNMLVGEEIKTPSVLPTSERPVMVTANAGAVKAGYEFVFTSSEKLKKANVNFYEMPYASMLDKKTNELKREFMEMDLAICVISATMPCTASDIAAIRAVAGGLVPTVIYVSKLDNLDDGDAAAEVKDYVESVMSKNFDAAVVGIIFGDNSDKSGEIYKFIEEIDLDELHEFRCARVERDSAECVKRALEAMLENVNKEKKERAEKNTDIDSENRDKKLLWDSIRIEMLARCQKCIDNVGVKIIRSKTETKSKVNAELQRAIDKKTWFNQSLPTEVNNETDKLSKEVVSYVDRAADADTAWMIAEVNEKFDLKLDITGFKASLEKTSSRGVQIDKSNDGLRNFGMAAGTAAIGIGAFIGLKHPIPQTMIVLSAVAATAMLVKSGIDKIEAYNEFIDEKAKEYCDLVYGEFTKNINAQIRRGYEKTISALVQYSMEIGEVKSDFSDLYQIEAEINEKINSLM